MPGASGVNVEGSCEALCRTLVSQNSLQRETTDISQSVLYTSLMGLLLVADEVCSINNINFNFMLRAQYVVVFKVFIQKVRDARESNINRQINQN